MMSFPCFRRFEPKIGAQEKGILIHPPTINFIIVVSINNYHLRSNKVSY